MALVWLLLAGVGGGFLAGLLGIGGGVVFVPALLFTFTALEVPEAHLAPLVVGTSLLCTFLTALSSAWSHYRHAVVEARSALAVGAASALAVYLTKTFVTTQPWYTPAVFAVVFGSVLTVVAVRMVNPRQSYTRPTPPRPSLPVLGGIGLASGSLASSAGVGGGVLLVPLFVRVLHMPMRRAVGTSSATIVLTALAGALTYAFSGSAVDAPGLVGYVDVRHGLALALPALVTARLGAAAAHRIDTRYLRWLFAGLALFMAARLILGALHA